VVAVSTSFAVVAKAAGSDEGPENTCEAIEHALSAPVPPWARLVIEIDVRLSADGRLVALHDADLARTTSGSGLVRQRPLSYLRTLLAGPRGERVPLLEEVLEAAPNHELVIEAQDRGREVADALVRCLRRSSAATRERSIIASEHHAPIRALRAVAPRLRTAGSAREVWRKLLCTRLGLESLCPRGLTWMVPARHRGLSVVTPRFVRGAARAGDEVWVFVVNDAAEVHSLQSLGVAGGFTTRPHALCAALSAGTARGALVG
jgi:glycerophosphoryl diester phosphodiesterase